MNTQLPSLELVIPVDVVINPDEPGYITPHSLQSFLYDYLPQECQSRFRAVTVKNAASNALVSRIVIRKAQGLVLDDTGVVLEVFCTVYAPDGSMIVDNLKITGRKDGIKGAPIPFRPVSALAPQMMKAADEFLASFRNEILQPCYVAGMPRR